MLDTSISFQQTSFVLLVLWLLGGGVVVALSNNGGLALSGTAAAATGRQRRSTQPAASLIEDPTPQDAQLEQWYADLGIRGIDRVKVRTCPRSVAGRGLFYYSSAQDGECAKKGDVLAWIPAQSVLCRENVQRLWPDFWSSQLDALERSDWPLALTVCAQVALQLDDNRDSRSPCWSPWIQTWTGPHGPQPPESLQANELEVLALEAKSSTEEIQRALQVRYDVFQQHCQRFVKINKHSTVTLNNNSNYYLNHDLYGIVLSRAANLGPHWNHQSGIIPLHDMINHAPGGVAPSVELFSIGDLVRQTSREYVEQQLLLRHHHSLQSTTQVPQQPPEEKDLLLVARRIIPPGEELFLSYANRDLLATNERDRVWKMLQYGFRLE